jgi:hypothetical protein
MRSSGFSQGDFRKGIFDGIDAKQPVTIMPVKNIMLYYLEAKIIP